MSAPTKKRRVELVQVAPAGGEASLQLSSFAPTLSLADGVTVTLSSTPPAKTETVANAESLAAVLKRRAEVARQTHDRWVRSPRAAWIQSLLAELGPPAREELLALQRRHTTLAAEDFATRWELGAEWSGRVVALWLGAEGRSVDEVIAKAVGAWRSRHTRDPLLRRATASCKGGRVWAREGGALLGRRARGRAAALARHRGRRRRRGAAAVGQSTHRRRRRLGRRSGHRGSALPSSSLCHIRPPILPPPPPLPLSAASALLSRARPRHAPPAVSRRRRPPPSTASTRPTTS